MGFHGTVPLVSYPVMGHDGHVGCKCIGDIHMKGCQKGVLPNNGLHRTVLPTLNGTMGILYDTTNFDGKLGHGSDVGTAGATGGVVLNNLLIYRHASRIWISWFLLRSAQWYPQSELANMISETSGSSNFKAPSFSLSCSIKQRSILEPDFTSFILSKILARMLSTLDKHLSMLWHGSSKTPILGFAGLSRAYRQSYILLIFSSCSSRIACSPSESSSSSIRSRME